MKTLARVLMILAAALAVVGVTFAVTQWGEAQDLLPGEGAGRRLGSEAADGPGIFESGESVAGRRLGRGPGELRGEGEFHEGREGGPAGGLGLVKNVAIFAGLAAAVAALSVIIDWVRRRRAAPPAAA